MLAGALTDLKEAGIEGPLFEKVQMKNINPKSVTMGQLYGESDRATQEWKDGILGLTFRQLASDPCDDRKWYHILHATVYILNLCACNRTCLNLSTVAMSANECRPGRSAGE